MLSPDKASHLSHVILQAIKRHAAVKVTGEDGLNMGAAHWCFLWRDH